MRGWRAAWAGLAALICATQWAVPGAAQQQLAATNQPVLMTADSLKYDQNLGQITAEGNVELVQEGRTLLADLVNYSERDGKVVASGNVSVMQPDGTVLFADYMELTDSMRNGFIRDVSMLLEDNSRAAAASAERVDGNRTVMHKAVYTACSLCATDPQRAPLWQVKGNTVVHDQVAQEMVYRDATLELFGIPVLYLPYFSHPDPTVKRKSGFLTPNAFTNNFFGYTARTPYFYAIDEASDLTLTPQYSEKEGGFLMGEYNLRTKSGELRMDASITQSYARDAVGQRTSDQFWRGHFRADGAFRSGDDTTYGFNIFRASDDTYLSRYQIPNRSGNTLISRVYSESLNNRHFFAANAFSFQGLRTSDDNATTPFAVPLLDYSMVGEPNSHGGRFAVDAGLAALYRTGGTDTRRLSTTISYSQPYFAPSGEVYTATAALKTDGYWVNELYEQPFLRTDQRDAEFAMRAIPIVALDWRYPLVRDDGTIRQLIEPILGVVVSPYGGNPRNIPNEDSLSFEFDETNLFSINRFPGQDRFDGGPRVNYGMRGAVYGSAGGYSELMVAQSLRAKQDDTLGYGTGASDQLSDYVSRLTLAPNSYISLTNRMRLSPNSSLSVQRHETTVAIGPKSLRFNATYADLRGGAFESGLSEREAISGGFRAQIGQYWSVEGRHIRDLGDNGGSLLNFLGLRYTDECFDIMLFAERTFTVNRDIQPATTVGLRFRLANFN
ncbi:LPS-assembly protein LptD [Ferrovibrio sp.]|uniref:LPS-assembly protein LptD n=1 Tax=Ferrovibrio sp. TaxID=1917215 RepID=UPI0035B0F0BB